MTIVTDACANCPSHNQQSQDNNTDVILWSPAKSISQQHCDTIKFLVSLLTMAPRTYLRKQVPVSTTKSAMAINTLLAKNMAKKCHSNGKHINHIDNSISRVDISVCLNKTDDSFTKLAKGENYNEVFFATDKIPYESYFSCTTVDPSRLMNTASSDVSSNLKLGSNNHSCVNDGCISKSLMLIESWEEPTRFVTQRKKWKRKTVHSFVKAKSFAKLKSANASRISNTSHNTTNSRQMNGSRLSKRLMERIFNGFRAEDASLSARQARVSSNSLSACEKAPDSETEKLPGFEQPIIYKSTNLSYIHNDSLTNQKIGVSVLEASSRLRHNGSIQNVSKPSALSVNNSTCDNNNIFLAEYTSTPFVNKQPSTKRLGAIITASPIMTRQTRARIRLNNYKTDSINNTDNNEISEDVPVKRKLSRGRPRKLDVSSTADISVDPPARRTRSRSCVSRIEQKIDCAEISKQLWHDHSYVRSPIVIISRSTSRSRCENNTFSLDCSVMDGKKNSSSFVDVRKSAKMRNSSIDKSARTSILKKETNKENVSSPFKRVTRRRKTVLEEKHRQSNENDIDSKSLTKKAIPACSMKNIFRMSPMLTRLQRRIILDHSNNNNTSNSMQNLKLELSQNNHKTPNEISIKQEPIDEEPAEYNYTIEDVTSTSNVSNGLQSDLNTSTSMRDFLPRYQGTPRNSIDYKSAQSFQRRSQRISSQCIDKSSQTSFVTKSAVNNISNLEDVQADLHVNEDALSECLFINNIKQEHNFAVPSRPAMRKAYAPGKGYRRSIITRKETVHVDEYPNFAHQSTYYEPRRSSIRLVPVSLQQNLAGNNVVPDEEPKRLQYQNSFRSGGNSIEHAQINVIDRSASILDESVDEEVAAQTAEDIVLRNCGQQQAEPWGTFYSNKLLKNCSKIGEGVYGEVFMFRNVQKTVSVMKVIPIEGEQLVNGERQKKFQDILSEIIIAKKLSSLPTSGFNRLEAVHLVHGAYPERLLDLWRLYDETKGSENDCPDTFQTEGQLYLILQLQNGGKDLESYEFKNAIEAYSIFVQICHAFAQAELHYSFEHRDLHWGNVLISQCPVETNLIYTLPVADNRDAHPRIFTVKTHGVQCNIIDFTLSRMTVPGGQDVVVLPDELAERTTAKRRTRSEARKENYVLYNDLNLDPELFNGDGDVQFDVYRQMRTEAGEDWSQFCPKTNVYWLNYILQKMLTEIEYSEPETRAHKSYLHKMRRCRSRIQQFSNCVDVVKSLR